MYEIQPYSYEQAKRLQVQIEPSQKSKYKISIFDKNGNHIYDIGAAGYSDFPTYWKEKGKAYAEKRRSLYHIRHSKDISKVGSRGWYASQILW